MTLAQLMKKKIDLFDPEEVTIWENTCGFRKGH